MITLQGTKQKEETLGLIAQAWTKAKVGQEIQITQPNELGGKSLEKLLVLNIPQASSESRNKSRIITLIKTSNTPPVIDKWLKHTELRLVEETGFYSMPGLFGWNKIDVGSQMLLDNLPDLKGVGADFGCGYGFLTKNIISKNEKIKIMYCFDSDLRALSACKKNIKHNEVDIRHVDCTKAIPDISPLDFVVMNPPFHYGADEDKSLGQKFIETAAHHLKKGGVLWLVANKHLPYEKILNERFRLVSRLVDEKGFKIIKALK